MLTSRFLLFKEGLLTLIILVLVLGSLALAIIDPGFRPAFADLSKVTIAGYLGWMMPRLPNQAVPDSSSTRSSKISRS